MSVNDSAQNESSYGVCTARTPYRVLQHFLPLRTDAHTGNACPACRRSDPHLGARHSGCSSPHLAGAHREERQYTIRMRYDLQIVHCGLELALHGHGGEGGQEQRSQVKSRREHGAGRDPSVRGFDGHEAGGRKSWLSL